MSPSVAMSTRWIDGATAAAALGTTTAHVRVLAHRHSWRRQRQNGRVHYSLDDVRKTHQLRERATRPRDRA